jgi:hypothetical protein
MALVVARSWTAAVLGRQQVAPAMDGGGLGPDLGPFGPDLGKACPTVGLVSGALEAHPLATAWLGCRIRARRA